MKEKDHAALAGAFAYTRSKHSEMRLDQIPATVEEWWQNAAAVANVLAADNPRFDRDHFIKACEGGDE